MSNVSKNHQLVINMISSFIAFMVSFGIQFFLTPYVVSKLGVEAYGFLGLSFDIIGYTSLVTIALNSMAGRFITIKYQEGNIEDANKYFSSVFFSNLILSGVILLALFVVLTFMESLFAIPSHLVMDIKCLFGLSIFTTIASLLTNVFAIATFVKNRLDLSSIRQIVSNIIRGTLIVALFGLFPAHLWYYGVVGVVVTFYITVTNIKFTKVLIPELHLSIHNYEWSKIKELLSSGVWNLFSKLGEILGRGLDLLIANLCIGAVEMGLFAITRNVPLLILSLFQMIAGVFAPLLTISYAKKEYNELMNEFNKSIRILCVFTAIPFVSLYIYGDTFYSLWLPNEDSAKLQLITILGTLALPFTLPLESLWNIFTITNKLKYSTIFTLSTNIVVFTIVMSSMFIFESHTTRLLVLATTRSLCGLVRGVVFLPIYGAHCLSLAKGYFYGIITRATSCMALCFGIGYSIRLVVAPTTWFSFFVTCFILALMCVMVASFIILTKDDRKFIKVKILHMK